VFFWKKKNPTSTILPAVTSQFNRKLNPAHGEKRLEKHLGFRGFKKIVVKISLDVCANCYICISQHQKCSISK
jgi:hypothetical protein